MSRSVFPIWKYDFSRWKKLLLLVTLVFLTIPMFLLESCQTAAEKAMPPAGRYIVSAQKTLFYRYGPAQASGPDLQLAKGQLFTVVKRQFGYSQIVLDDGRSGYVSTEDIAPAPPEPKPTPAKKSRGNLPESSFVPPVTPLPLPEQPAPNFRY